MSNGIKIVLISGSVRPDNNTRKALQLVVDELRNVHKVQAVLVDPSSFNLPLPGQRSNEDVEWLQEEVKSATGLVLATPEYHGSFSSVIKLVIENLGFPSAMAGKPVSLLGVAAGSIGAVKSLESLAGVCLHVGCIVLPGQVSVAHVRKVFDESGNCLDEKIEKMIRGIAGHMMNFIKTSICPGIALEETVRED
jgi:FMN reductase